MIFQCFDASCSRCILTSELAANISQAPGLGGNPGRNSGLAQGALPLCLKFIADSAFAALRKCMCAICGHVTRAKQCDNDLRCPLLQYMGAMVQACKSTGKIISVQLSCLSVCGAGTTREAQAWHTVPRTRRAALRLRLAESSSASQRQRCARCSTAAAAASSSCCKSS